MRRHLTEVLPIDLEFLELCCTLVNNTLALALYKNAAKATEKNRAMAGDIIYIKMIVYLMI